jgi:YggT family protein
MFILGNFIIAAARVLDVILFLYTWIIFVRAIISWVNPDPWNPIVQFLHRVTEPILQPIRRLMPFGPMDFSPIIVFVIIIFLRSFLVVTLMDIGSRMKLQSSQPASYSFDTVVPAQNKSSEDILK